MKRTFSLIALVAICSAMMVSCKNNKQSEPTPEEVQEQKTALADSVLAKIDEYAEKYIQSGNDGNFFKLIELTDAEKMIKPDYLLEPGEAVNFITKEQKVSALAIYGIETHVRRMYDMPTDEVKEAMAKLAAEVNHPITKEFADNNESTSEMIREAYKVYKERGELAYFWQFENAVLREIDYLVAKNPELYLGKIGEDNYSAWGEQWSNFIRAIIALAPYDEEINNIAQTISAKTEEDIAEKNNVDFPSIEGCIKTFQSGKYQFVARRNALLQ